MLNRNRVWERHPWECTDQPHYLSADHSDFQCPFLSFSVFSVLLISTWTFTVNSFPSIFGTGNRFGKRKSPILRQDEFIAVRYAQVGRQVSLAVRQGQWAV